MAICLQRGQQDVDEPEREEQKHSEQLGGSRATQLAPGHGGPTAVKKNGDGQQCHDCEEGDGKSKGARRDLELFSLTLPVHGGDGPCHSDSKEDVHCVTTGHVSNGRVRVLVLDGCHFTGKGVCG